MLSLCLKQDIIFFVSSFHFFALSSATETPWLSNHVPQPQNMLFVSSQSRNHIIMYNLV